MGAITLNDVLNIKALGKFRWSPDGAKIAFIWDDGGVTDLWVADHAKNSYRKISSAKDSVPDFDYNPVDSRLVFIQDGTIHMCDKANEEAPHPWFKMQEPVSRVLWSPDGRTLAFVRHGKVAVYDEEHDLLKELNLPGRVAPGGPDGGVAIEWSQDSRLLAFGFADELKSRHIGVSDTNGNGLFRTIDADPSASPAWIDANTLYFARLRQRGTSAEYYMVSFASDGPDSTLKAGTPKLFHTIKGDGRGNVYSTAAYPSPDGKTVLFLLENDDWAHLYAYCRTTGEMKQITFGEHEDFGYAGDAPDWSPDSARVVFASNKGDLHERHLWILDFAAGETKQLDCLSGTSAQARWAPNGRQIMFAHSDVYRNLDIWVMDIARPEQASQLTFSMPIAWTTESISVPEHVTFKGAERWDIHGFVTKPHGFDPNKKYPALVWVHGGPMRQMRQGFNPLHGYAAFHAFHQYLAHKGYVSITVNFRGGIGYGRKFRTGLFHKMGVHDVVDVVSAGRYLKTLPYVNPAKVAVWGISYGGYMTLHSLTQYPEEFCMGINVAGIWDFSQWTRWIQSRRGSQGGLFVTYFGGFPEESPEIYRIGSPYTYAAQMTKPLINFMGTADANVDFAQLDRIVLDCVKLGKKYEAYYYPDEVHMFRWRSTWADAFPKIEREFEKYLK